jgi:hypothetical protein
VTEYITDEYGDEYELVDEDEDDGDELLTRAEFEEWLAEQQEHEAYADQEAEDAWLDHLAMHVSAAEQALGRELTNKELSKFADDLEASGGEAVDIEGYHRDLGNDDDRVGLLAEYVDTGVAGEEAPEGGEE